MLRQHFSWALLVFPAKTCKNKQNKNDSCSEGKLFQEWNLRGALHRWSQLYPHWQPASWEQELPARTCQVWQTLLLGILSHLSRFCLRIPWPCLEHVQNKALTVPKDQDYLPDIQPIRKKWLQTSPTAVPKFVHLRKTAVLRKLQHLHQDLVVCPTPELHKRTLQRWALLPDVYWRLSVDDKGYTVEISGIYVSW